MQGFAVKHRDTGHDLMAASREALQHRHAVRFVLWLAEGMIVENDFGVGPDDELVLPESGPCFAFGQAQDKILRCLSSETALVDVCAALSELETQRLKKFSTSR
jgi:hypothetical protein